MIFVDSWAWIALAADRDQHHAAATAQHAEFRKRREKYVTTSFVLSETITYLYGNGPAAEARSFVEAILLSSHIGDSLVVYIDRSHFERAWILRQRYHDKPDISFVDLTSMVVMQDLGITEVFTGDAHFRQVGLGFQLRPGRA